MIQNNLYIDSIISLSLIYGMLGILASLILEWYNSYVRERGAFLQRSIVRLLDDPKNYNYGHLLYQHPLINRMRKDKNSFPYYIDEKTFAQALIDIIANNSSEIRLVQNIQGDFEEDNDRSKELFSDRILRGINSMAQSELKFLLKSFADQSTEVNASGLQVFSVEKFKTTISDWYKNYMDRITGEYKSATRPKLLIIGFLLTLSLNIDSIHLLQVVINQPELRNSLVNTSENLSDNNFNELPIDGTFNLRRDVRSDSLIDESIKIYDKLNHWKIPIGWSKDEAPLSWFSKRNESEIPSKIALHEISDNSSRSFYLYAQERNDKADFKTVFIYLIGLVISTISISFGAPFWFDVLVKFINIRRAGIKPKN